MSFIIPAGEGRTSRRMRALLMPMSIVSAQCTIRPDRDLQTIREPLPRLSMTPVHTDPVRGIQTMFIAEVSDTLLREGDADAALFDFLQLTMETLVDLPADRILNFHIAFLRQLVVYLGIEPDFRSYRQGRFLDLSDGIFRMSPPLHSHWLDARDSSTAHLLSRINYANMHRFCFSRTGRNDVTDHILSYITLHLAPMDRLRSLPVLRSL